jgi:hypothetical protein
MRVIGISLYCRKIKHPVDVGSILPSTMGIKLLGRLCRIIN